MPKTEKFTFDYTNASLINIVFSRNFKIELCTFKQRDREVGLH